MPLFVIVVIDIYQPGSLLKTDTLNLRHQKKMKKSFEPVEVNIIDLHVDGYGTTSDLQLCVYGALPGERVVALPFTRMKRKTFDKTIDVQNASKDRVRPPCSAADYCGGCSLQHLSTDAQIVFKQQQLVDALGETEPDTYFSPLTGPVGDYRSKARLGVKYVDKKERVLVGFREKLKPFIADVSHCYVLRKPVSDLIPELADLVADLVNPRSIPQIEVAVSDTETALVFRHLEDLSKSDLEALRQFGDKHHTNIYLQSGNAASTYRIFPEVGNDLLVYHLSDFDLEFEFHPLDFTQINHVINRKMVNRAVELLELTGSDYVLDAFCGIGNFSLPIARIARNVIGIEASGTSVHRAMMNSRQNGINNCVFIAEDLFAESLTIPALQDVNKVLLDPPRSGALGLCKTLASNKVERVVYVSCNPATLARDAAVLVAEGYQFEGAGVIDMFPHTTHVESIACFSQLFS